MSAWELQNCINHSKEETAYWIYIKNKGYGICEDCGKMIDTDRLMIYPEATLCVSCEAKKEKKRNR